MMKKLVCVFTASLVLASSTSALAAQTAFLKVKGQVQKTIAGGVTARGREGTSSVIATNHQIISPRDAASGLPTGRRMHKELSVTMEVDKSLPLLYRALVTNENLTEVTVQYFRPPTGEATARAEEQQFYTVKLTNANISAIRFQQPNQLNPDTKGLPDTVTIDFTYQKINWTWTDGNITSEDSWQTAI